MITFKENNHFYEKIGNEVIDITNELPFEIISSKNVSSFLI